jgi:hypothetical protein
MSKRSIYFRDQAEKCRWHASRLDDVETQAELRKLADEYVVRAEDIESNESFRLSRHVGHHTEARRNPIRSEQHATIGLVGDQVK